MPALPLDRGPFSPSEIAIGEDWKFVGEALTSVIPQEAFSHSATLQEAEIPLQEPNWEEQNGQDFDDESHTDTDSTDDNSISGDEPTRDS